MLHGVVRSALAETELFPRFDSGGHRKSYGHFPISRSHAVKLWDSAIHA